MNINLDKIKNAKWYRQRTSSVPYFIFGPALGVLALLKGNENVFFYITPREMRLYFNERFFLQKAKAELKKFKSQSGYLSKIRGDWLEAAKKLKDNIKIISRLDVEKISDSRLIKLNKEFGTQAWKIWEMPIFLDIFDSSTETLIHEELSNDGVSMGLKDLQLLTFAGGVVAIQQYNLSLLSALNAKTVISEGRLRKIAEEFFFINGSYANGSKLKTQEVLKELKTIKTKGNIKPQFLKLRDYQKQIKRQKLLMVKKYKLSNKLKRVFESFSAIAVWRDQRKVLLQKTACSLNILGQEISKRSRLSWKQISMCPPFKVTKIPVTTALVKKFQDLFTKRGLIYYDNKSNRCKFIGGSLQKKIMGILEPKHPEVSTLKGQTASGGKIVGVVKIIQGEEDFHKFKAGEILVTAMTRPEFLPLMRKAKAIITDEGGITSHAAIISRELKIPCIIGTRVATRVLKNGTKVEVNANKGIITKL